MLIRLKALPDGALDPWSCLPLNDSQLMLFCSCQVRNKLSREEAERAFMEIEVTDEEREGLEQEIREVVVSQEEEDISEHEWIDESEAADNDFENTIIVEDSD